VHAPCYAAALTSAISGAASGETIVLAPGCVYRLATALPTIGTDTTMIGYDTGAIYNDDDLTTADNTLDGNRAYEGGGIYEETAALDDNGSLIMSNAATHLGGGIYNGSRVDMMLDDTTVFLNVVDNIYNHGDC